MRGREQGRSGLAAVLCGYTLQILCRQKSKYFTIYEHENVNDVIT